MNIDDNLKITYLIDIYGSLLTNKQLQICKYYFFDNLTLAEIGEILNISRQAVADCIEKSKNLLEDYEEKIGKLKQTKDLKNDLNMLKNRYKDESLTKDIEKILNKLL